MKIIKRNGQSKLVEIVNGQRFYLPVWSDNISLAVPADIWGQLVSPELAKILRQKNIHNSGDLQKHPELAQITMNHGTDYYSLLKKAKEIEK